MTWTTRLLLLAIAGVSLDFLANSGALTLRSTQGSAKPVAPNAAQRGSFADRAQAAGPRPLIAAPAAVAPNPPPAPTQDLLLTGVIGMGSQSCALFTITEPNTPSCRFGLREGEQNAWMRVRSIDAERGTVQVVLKRPVVRIRQTGVDVLLSLAAGRSGRQIN